jgi:spore coat polysaccharide biosynthesis predicted glycosyltransferase SpsG
LSLGALSGPQLIDLLSGARIAIISGGSLLSQALALRVPCIAAPVAGDQDARIRACVARGLLLSTSVEVDALVGAAMSLLKDPAQLNDIRVRLSQLDLNNSVDVALAALERLLDESSAR